MMLSIDERRYLKKHGYEEHHTTEYRQGQSALVVRETIANCERLVQSVTCKLCLPLFLRLLFQNPVHVFGRATSHLTN